MSLSSMINPVKATLTVALCSMLFASCKPGAESKAPPIHLNPNMDSQEKYRAQSESPFFKDKRTMRTPEAETVAFGTLVQTPEIREGKTAAGEFVAKSPSLKDLNWNKSYGEFLKHGQKRYDIYCTPCHGELGDGNGMVAKRGFNGVANLQLSTKPVGGTYEYIVKGGAIMPAHGVQIPKYADRWAIVEYVQILKKAAATEEYKQLIAKKAK